MAAVRLAAGAGGVAGWTPDLVGSAGATAGFAIVYLSRRRSGDLPPL